jgi:2-hydroxychromene-2-carboxylate isomerase
MSKALEFFFDYASPYSYLASTQVERVCERTHAELKWRPVLLGAIFKASGNTSPAATPAKAMYLFKDLTDWARHYGLPSFVLPEAFPINSLKADRVGVVALEQGRISAFTRAAYAAAFQKGRDLNEPAVLADVLTEAGMDARDALARAETQAVKDALRANTDEALSRGAFGLPLFFIGDDMYVGNDRLPFVEAALR